MDPDAVDRFSARLSSPSEGLVRAGVTCTNTAETVRGFNGCHRRSIYLGISMCFHDLDVREVGSGQLAALQHHLRRDGQVGRDEEAYPVVRRHSPDVFYGIQINTGRPQYDRHPSLHGR
jgi:hypothetical protein